jgi:hypothetical protein
MSPPHVRLFTARSARAVLVGINAGRTTAVVPPYQDRSPMTGVGLTTRFDETNRIFANHELLGSLDRPGRTLRSIASMGRSGSSIVVASVGRQILPAPDTEAAPSLLWFATTQCIESKQDLAGLAPKGCFIPAKPVERIGGHGAPAWTDSGSTVSNAALQ